ncbi:MAG TPA: DUF5667 domain-containing protein [Pseudonocardia sp.]|nr:DUF5667 domain-containing protein [Pseudonocardia sp.]
MPAGQGKDEERFAAAVESGTPLGAAGDDDLARELEIVAMLRSRGAEYAPDAAAKARAKQRLMAVLAAEHGGQPRVERPRPQRDVPPPAAAERTAPLGRLVEPPQRDVDPGAETTRMAPVTARQDVAPDEDAGDETGAHVPKARPGRRARHSTTNRPAGRARSSKRPAAGGLRRRALLVGSAAMVAMLVIAGGGIFASQDALPGDNLYAVKRAAESAGLALTFDDASKARRQLEIAATRLSEAERLAALEAQAAPAPEVFTQVMDEFDAATDQGSRLLLESAAPDAETTAASTLHTWASEQSERLTEIRPALPAAAEADESIELLDRLLGRTGSTGEDSPCDGDDCTSRDGDATRESDETDATSESTTTPDESDSTGSTETDEPSRTRTGTPEGEEPRLLPDLVPDANREGEDEDGSSTRNEDGGTTSTPDPDSGGEGDEGGNVSVPLPLLPPVTLPPLLPGLPGITIG